MPPSLTDRSLPWSRAAQLRSGKSSCCCWSSSTECTQNTVMNYIRQGRHGSNPKLDPFRLSVSVGLYLDHCWHYNQGTTTTVPPLSRINRFTLTKTHFLPLPIFVSWSFAGLGWYLENYWLLLVFSQSLIPTEKFIPTWNWFLAGIDSAMESNSRSNWFAGIDSLQVLIARRNWFLAGSYCSQELIPCRFLLLAGIDSSCMKISKKEREGTCSALEESIFQLLKFMIHGLLATLFLTRFLLGSYSVTSPNG